MSQWRPACVILISLIAIAGMSAQGTAASRDRGDRGDPGDLQAMVKADWAAQETRLGRTAGSPESIREALKRASLLVDDLRAQAGMPDLAADAKALDALKAEAEKVDSLDEAGRLALYQKVRGLVRDVALKNPLVTARPIVFMKRHRFACQMLHEYVAYFSELGRCYGGGVYMLEEPGKSLKTRDLLEGRLPLGCYTTLAISYDAKTVYFAFGECRGEPVEYGSPQQPHYNLFALDLPKNELRQLTHERFDDFDPCPLPDGGLAFISTRRGGYTRCNNPWEPIPVYTLHRMDTDGENIRTLSFHETNEWHPSVLNDGRIAYTRWDYVDRSAANFHGLWVTNPDGTAPVSLFGNYTAHICACYEPHAIPGSQKVLFVAGAHHADVGGTLVLLDPSRVGLDAAKGGDRFDAVEVLTPEVSFPEGNEKDGGWPKSYFHSPWPLSEKYFLTSFGYGPIPGMSSGGKKDTTGLYYLDRFGNLELLYRDARDSRTAPMYPITLMARSMPPVAKGTHDSALADEGEFMIDDVRQSHMAMPPGRTIRELRVFQVLPKTTPTANEPRIGHANAEGARMLLGTVPVEADGSVYFRAPAQKPLYFQAVDADGHAIQSMRSVTYLQPGERRGCVGCHEPVGATPASTRPTAFARAPSAIKPGPDGSRPFSYPRLVQPVLDRHCVQCHDGSKGEEKSTLVLTGEADGPFTKSYATLKPYLAWYEWGGASISDAVTQPGHIGADASRLTKVLADARHAPKVKLPDEDRERLMVWLDGNVPFYGTYGKDEQARQRAGEAVPPPSVQ